jgi:hypothetical protein
MKIPIFFESNAAQAEFWDVKPPIFLMVPKWTDEPKIDFCRVKGLLAHGKQLLTSAQATTWSFVAKNAIREVTLTT